MLFLMAIFFLACLVSLGAQAGGDSLQAGIDAFMNDRPSDASSYFETAISQGNTEPDTFLYLAYSYEQLGLYSQGIQALERGLPYSRDKRYLFYFNAGNLYQHMSDTANATAQYSLAIATRGTFADAYLNRGNSYIRTWELQSAKSDYQTFIRLDPSNALVPEVQKMLAAIDAELVAEEERKAEEERIAQEAADAEAAAAAEAERIAAEEAARTQALLNSILGNLDKAGEETQTVGAGTEGISDDEDDYQRAD